MIKVNVNMRWLEVWRNGVYSRIEIRNDEEALQIINALQQRVQPTLLTLCPECGVKQIVTHLPTCAHYVAQSG
jgi:hypothetical protein